MHQHEKSAQLIHSFIHSPCDQDGHNHFWPHHPNIFLSTLNFWYQHVKKKTNSLLYSKDIFDLKSCSLIGQHHFGPGMTEKKTIFNLRQKVYRCIYTHFDVSKSYKSLKTWSAISLNLNKKTKWVNGVMGQWVLPLLNFQCWSYVIITFLLKIDILGLAMLI